MRVGVQAIPNGPATVLLPLDLEDPDVPTEVREGIVRRRLLLTTGECPCGARLTLDDQVAVALLRRRGQTSLTFAVPTRHEPGCPATLPEINALMRSFAATLLAEAGR